MPAFSRVHPSADFPAMEETVLDLWDRLDAFARSVEQRPLEEEFTFYDGPPFPTGSPHYGNLLAGVLKDIVPRYWAMRGKRVKRRFGWDTHGLPIEMEVEKQLELHGPADIARIGIDVFNEACRARVQANTETWEAITRRIGRWVDFEDDYKTMDTDFMETVWWVFKRLWDEGLIYQDFKVLPYSFGATTPLSNFEANLDYRDVEDPSIVVRLEITEGSGAAAPGDHLLVWTTTPWTLPSNLAVAVGEDLLYARVDGSIGGKPGRYWVAAERVNDLFGDEATVGATARGVDLVGARYRPVFDFFGEEADRGAFVVLTSPEVSTEEGTGLVHMAPAYGEADFIALQNAGLDVLVDPVDAEGRFTEAVPPVAGQNVKVADAELLRLLRQSGDLVVDERITHSYPYCWRTKTPLIYKAIPTWFVAVESFRDRMVELNKTIHWVPEAIGRNRFGNWLEGARDWAISRNRYWGSCIPVWECDNCDERVCIGSIAELGERSGVYLDDLHKHVVDPVTFPCTECSGTMRRVPEVLDCWFESGSMPYAENHYPFENSETFERRFPAEYIAEGIDQTRGWFYTLLVLSTALFDDVPFRNCVVNGFILAEDGRKMSKSLKNYPDPFEVLDAFGADALRAFLINSPVVRGESLRFSESGVREVVRTVLLPYWNAYSFFTTYAAADGLSIDELNGAPSPAERPEIDRWILSVLQSLVKTVNEEMEGYYLYNVIPPLIDFIDDLTNWYIRRSRPRFWGRRDTDQADRLAAFATLYEVLTVFSKLMAPVLPFITETIHQGLVVDQQVPGAMDSVHLEDYPEARLGLIDDDLESEIVIVRDVVAAGRSLRVGNALKVRQPLETVTVVSHDDAVRSAVTAHQDLIADELNVRGVAVSDDETATAHLGAKADFSRLGPRLGARVKEVAAAIEELDETAIAELIEGGTVEVAGERLTLADIVVTREARSGVVVATHERFALALDTTLTPSLRREGLAREVVKTIQGLRRDAGLDVSDRIDVRWNTTESEAVSAFKEHGDTIAQEVLAVSLRRDESLPVDGEVDGVPMGVAVTPVEDPRRENA